MLFLSFHRIQLVNKNNFDKNNENKSNVDKNILTMKISRVNNNNKKQF